jgi:ATP-dependent Zn protease
MFKFKLTEDHTLNIDKPKKQKYLRILLLGGAITLCAVTAYNNYYTKPEVTSDNYTQIFQEINENKISHVEIMEKSTGIREITVFNKDNNTYKVNGLTDEKLLPALVSSGIKTTVKAEPQPGFLEKFFFNWGPTIFLLVVWIWFMRGMLKNSGGGKLFSFSNSKAQLQDPDTIDVTFKDIVGCDEAKFEIQEFTDFFHNPEKYQKLGGKTPRGVLLTGPAGTGKAQPLYSNIKVPAGWKKMGAIQVNDLVCNPDGGYSKVIGLYPQGLKKNYQITFSDGSTAESCYEHLWTVHFNDLHKDYKTYSLLEIQEKMKNGYSPIVYPITKIDSPHVELPIDPYFLGVILGGNTSISSIVDSVSTKDDAIVNYVKETLSTNYQDQNILTQQLSNIGIYGNANSIPAMYLDSSYEQRLSLLQGLMDKDGTIDKSSTLSHYFTNSEELANNTVDLARSLGMIASSNLEKTKAGKSYHITINSYEPSNLFRLSNKKDLATTKQNVPTKSIVKVEYIGETEMQCIMLDSQNHLYITDGYNVTHNTLLAKALAKESKVPFYAVSGSEFVEMFAGVGASRVRDMFAKARASAPCVLFIDEIDALASKRSQGAFSGGASTDEREQTLNQLLVEMDGIDNTSQVIVVGATNRPEVLDPAIMRPGRFDRQVVVPLPDVIGREIMLQTHINLKKVPISTNVDLHRIARGTPGFSGAEIANLVNESAIFAARRGGQFVEQIDLEQAKDKIMMGPERPSMAMTEEDKKDTAYHESGHAIVAKVLKDSDPVYKVTIIPRGRALGLTQQLPEKERFSYKKEYLMDRIVILMGGRAAEQIFCNTLTTGASNDIAVATSMARSMVMEWGMTALGPIGFGSREQTFLGGSSLQSNNVSEKTRIAIDDEVAAILTQAAKTSEEILQENKERVENMTQALMEIETLEDWQIENIMNDLPYNDVEGMLKFKDHTNKKIEAEKQRRANIENKTVVQNASPTSPKSET